MRDAISVIHAVDNAATFKWLVAELGRTPEADELDPVMWDMVNEGRALTEVDHVGAVDDLHAQARLAARALHQPACCSARRSTCFRPSRVRCRPHVGPSTRSSTSNSRRLASRRLPTPRAGRRSRSHLARSRVCPSACRCWRRTRRSFFVSRLSSNRHCLGHPALRRDTRGETPDAGVASAPAHKPRRPHARTTATRGRSKASRPGGPPVGLACCAGPFARPGAASPSRARCNIAAAEPVGEV